MPLPNREIAERSAIIESNVSVEKKSLNIYPNVTNSTFTVESSGYEGARYVIYDIQGNKITNGVISKDYNVNVNDWSQGTYIFVIYEDGIVSDKKLVIVSK